MHFPVSGVDISPIIPPLVAFAVSFFTSMGGISGAFLLLPFQMSVLGYTSPSVSATNHLFNVIAIPGGVWRFIREGRMLWPLALILLLGTLPGVFIGGFVRVRWLPEVHTFKLFTGLVLLYIGWRLVADLLHGRRRNTKKGTVAGAQPSALGDFHVQVLEFSARRLRYAFAGHAYDCFVPGLFSAALLVGVVGGAYGIGGGAIFAPILAVFFGLPLHTVGGATLLATFFTSLVSVPFYMLLSLFFKNVPVFPDFYLGLLFGLGGLAGIYLGARCQKYVPEKPIKIMLAAIILGTAVKYALDFFIPV